MDVLLLDNNYIRSGSSSYDRGGYSQCLVTLNGRVGIQGGSSSVLGVLADQSVIERSHHILG